MKDGWKKTVENDHGKKWELYTLDLHHPFMLRVVQYTRDGEEHLYYGELVYRDKDGCLSDPIVEVKNIRGDLSAKHALMLEVHNVFAACLPLMGPQPEKPEKSRNNPH